MKGEWQRRKLVDVATLQRGFDLPTQKRVMGQVPIVTSSGISDRHNESAAHGPGVATGRSGSIGNVFFIEEDYWPLNTVLYVKDFHGNDPRFVYYLLMKFDLRRFATGTGVPTLNRNFVHDELVSVPTLPEQQRIVTVLDDAFAAIATARTNAEQNLRNLGGLLSLHLSEIFTQPREGWRRTTLGGIAKIKGGKRVPKGYRLLAEPTSFPYLRVTDFNDQGTVDTADLRYVDHRVHSRIASYIIKAEDLYISIAGTIGKAGVVPVELDGAHLTENACRLVFDQGISNRFVYYFTQTEEFRSQAGLNTRTAAQPKLALARLATISLNVPSLAVQREVVGKLDALVRQVRHAPSTSERKLAAVDALKQSLLHQAFTGAL